MVPWTALWDRNAFAAAWPWLQEAMANPFVRGGVSGVGLVTTLAGLRDLTGAIFARHAVEADAVDRGPGTP